MCFQPTGTSFKLHLQFLQAQYHQAPPSPNMAVKTQEVQDENVREEFLETWLWLDFKTRRYQWRLVFLPFPFISYYTVLSL